MSIQDLTAEGGPATSQDELAVPLEEALEGAEEKRAVRRAAREQAVGLRALADMLERHPELAVRLAAATRRMGVHVFADEQPRQLFAEFARAALSSGAKVTKPHHGEFGKVCASWGPVSLHLQADREQVCERVATGVETVTTTIKDPAAVAALPDIEVTEEVATYEWQCGRPLLAESTGDAE